MDLYTGAGMTVRGTFQRLTNNQPLTPTSLELRIYVKENENDEWSDTPDDTKVLGDFTEVTEGELVYGLTLSPAGFWKLVLEATGPDLQAVGRATFRVKDP